MTEFLQAIPFSFAALFPVLNPLGSAVIFLTLTMGMSDEVHYKLARKVAVNAFVLLVVILSSGSWILKFFGITIPVVQIAGGIVVAFIGWSLLHQATTGVDDDTPVNREIDPEHMAFFPLTMPLTAGPGSIAVTLTVGAHQVGNTLTDTLLGQAGAIAGILLACICVFLCYRYANRVTRAFGPTGTQIVMRLSAFINLCIGIQIFVHGVTALIPPSW